MNDALNLSSCRAAVFHGTGKPFALTDIREPELRDGEALVEVTCCTICGSDMHTFTGRRRGAEPTVLGHEIIGKIRSVGDSLKDTNGRDLQPGDRITWSVAASCGCCHRCNDEMPQKCDSLFKYGHECFDVAALSGGLATHCVLAPGTAIVRLPSGIPDDVAAPANCATATVAAAVRQAKDLHDRRVLVIGAGMLGLTTCAFAKVAGARHIQLCDVDESRLRRGPEFGATHVSMSANGQEFDRVIEMSGNSSAVQQAISAAAIGGIVVLVGSVSPCPPVSIDPERIVRRLLTIHGVHNYRPGDLDTAVSFLAKHHSRFPFAELVERSFDLNQVDAAFAWAEQNRPIRISVRSGTC